MWQTVKLGDVCEFENGDRGKNYPSKKHQISEGIPFINAGDLTNDGEISTKGMAYISDERFNLLGAGKVRINDVLFCLRGSLGKCAINKVYSRGAIASSLVILRPDQNAIIPEYLLYLLKSVITMDLIVSTAGGAAQPNLSAKTVSNYEFPIPPLAEQQKIVEKLDRAFEEIDRAIEATECKQEEVKALKSAILSRKLNSTELAKIVKLGDVTFPIENTNPSTEAHSYFTYIDVSSVDREKLKIVEVQRLLGKNAPSRARRLVNEGDVLFATIRPTLKRIALVEEEYDGCICSTGYYVLKPKRESLLPKYVFYFMQTSYVMDAMEKQQTGASYPAVSDKQVKDLDISIPPLAEQQKIVEKLDQVFKSADEALESFSNQLENYKQLKSAILAQELKGPES